MLVLTREKIEALLNSATAVGGILNGCVVRLHTHSSDLGQKLKLEDLDEPAFPGYAPSTPVVWGAAINQVGGGMAVYGSVKQFAATAAPTAPVYVYGYFLTTAGDTPQLIGADFFPARVAIAAEDDGVVVQPAFAIKYEPLPLPRDPNPLFSPPPPRG